MYIAGENETLESIKRNGENYFHTEFRLRACLLQPPSWHWRLLTAHRIQNEKC